MSPESHAFLASELATAQIAVGIAAESPEAWAHQDCLRRERRALQVAQALASVAAENALVMQRLEGLVEELADQRARLAVVERSWAYRLSRYLPWGRGG